MNPVIRGKFLLDSGTTFLNHGSYGACPEPVLAAAEAARLEIERNPNAFFSRGVFDRFKTVKQALGRGIVQVRAKHDHDQQGYPPDLNHAYDRYAAGQGPHRDSVPVVRQPTDEPSLVGGLGADPACLALVPNVTVGVNVVARSLDLRPGDEVVAGDHEYGACARTLDFMCRKAGARLVWARIPIPLGDRKQVVDAYAAAMSPRTRLVLASHVTSPTAIVLPVEELVALARGRGVPIIIDGAHGPGQLALDLDRLGADWYTGNFHKWLCSPRVAGFLHARADRRERLEPLIVSWGWPRGEDWPLPSPGGPGPELRWRDDLDSLTANFDWPGTPEPTAFLALPAAIGFLESVGGIAAVQDHGRALGRRAREIMARRLGATPVCREEDSAPNMTAMLLPASAPEDLGLRLVHEHRIENAAPELMGRRILRISCAVYNDEADLERLDEALRQIRGQYT